MGLGGHGGSGLRHVPEPLRTEHSLNCTRSKDTTSCIQNNTYQVQLYVLKVSPYNYETISDPNHSLPNNHPYFLPAPIIILDKQLM